MLALAGMARSVDEAAGGFVLDAVIAAVGPGHAAVGEPDRAFISEDDAP